ncbi:MAG: hypothetical protein RI907_2696 [Pseudomonadota bacterium]|jgi:nitrogen-specific signal transduction histidine kinase
MAMDHDPPAPPQAELLAAYQGLLQLVHHLPVGVVQADRDGRIHLMNPKATQMLAPLGFGEGELNLFDILDRASPDLRTLVEVFKGQQGLICENHRIELPTYMQGGARTEVLGLTVTQLLNVAHSLLVVITDETHVERLRRIKASQRPAR